MDITPVRTLITDKVRGKTVDFIGIRDNYLVIATTDGQAFRLAWRDESNNMVPGSPSLEGIDVNIIIDPLEIMGSVG